MATKDLNDARTIRLRRSTRRFSGSLDGGGDTDLFQFKINRRPAIFNAFLRENSANVKLELLDSQGDLILRSDFPGRSGEIINPPTVAEDSRLRPARLREFFEETVTRGGNQFQLLGNLPLKVGTYFLRVSGNSTDYELSATAVPDTRFSLPPRPIRIIERDRLEDAKLIRVNKNTRRFRGRLGGDDTEDFFRFRITRFSFFSTFLDKLRANANLELVNSEGRVITRSAKPGSTLEVINFFPPQRSLAPGVYYIRVYKNGSQRTRYRLSVTAIIDPTGGRRDDDDNNDDDNNNDLRLVRDIAPGSSDSDPRDLTAFRDRLFFSAFDSANGRELWVSDGTANGTTLLRNIAPGATDSDLRDLTVVGNFLYFSADDAVNGRELWRTDGTANGTTLVRNIAFGSADSDPTELANINGVLYFSATESIGGRELWRSDGTVNGTSRVADIVPGTGSSNPFDITEFNGQAYFAATNAVNGTELWRSNGTSAGTTLVRDILAGTTGSLPNLLVAFGNRLYFSANDGITGFELWRSDGTSAGTSLFFNLDGAATSSLPLELTVSGNAFYFSASRSAEGRELWRSNGTVNGTQLVLNIDGTSADSFPAEFIDVDGVVYFTAFTAEGRQLWRSEGTAQTTSLVTTGTATTFAVGELERLGNFIYFTAETTGEGRELWRIALS